MTTSHQALVYDDRDNSVIFKGTVSECMIFLSAIPDTTEEFHHYWLEEKDDSDKQE